MNVRPAPDDSDGHRWIIAAALALSVLAFITFISLAQVASRGAGERIMARTVVAITEIDDSMPRIMASLEETADQSEVDPIPVPNFPVPVEVSRAAVISGDPQNVRDEILAQSAAQMYDDGVSTWDDTDPDARQAIARSSTAGGIRAVLSLVGGTPRTAFLALAAIATLATLALAFALTLQMSALARLTALGAALAVAGMPAVIVVLIVRVITSSAGDDAFGGALSDIAVDAEGVGLRNALIVALLGVALLALGVGATMLESRQEGPNGLSFDSDI